MTNPSFQDVTDRLLLALSLKKEMDLGAALGFTQSAWSVRKMRGSLPIAEIDELLAREQISPEYIYKGVGNVFDMDGWVGEYKLRVADLRIAKLPAVREMGHKEQVMDALINMDEKDKFRANAYAFITALRDSFKLTELDITQLITGVDLRNDTDRPIQGLTKDEILLIEAYRNADKQGKSFIQRAADMASAQGGSAPARPPSGSRNISIGGSVHGGTVNTGKITKGR
jgi:hypothetical protein